MAISAEALASTKPVDERAGPHILVQQHGLEKSDVRRHARDVEFAECPVALARHVLDPAGAGENDQLGEQRIVSRIGRVAGIAIAVDANIRAGGWLERAQDATAGLGRPVGLHRLDVDAELHRHATRRRSRAARKAKLRQGGAARQPELQLDQIEARDRFRHRMLDLQARVRLDEVEGAAGAIHEELERAEAAVVRGARERQGGIEQLLTHARIQVRRGSELDELLPLALERAVAFPQMRDLRPIADHLHLDVARMAHELLDVKIARAEGGGCLRSATGEGLLQRAALPGPGACRGRRRRRPP